MDWEDCVVDVHSVKLSKSSLESMFRGCGAVRSITHWKGQGEKPHVFFEYKTASSADAARLIGLERGDLQVIKISNNDMLKKKFRDVAHGPICDRSTSRSFSYRDANVNAAAKDHRLPAKPVPVSNYASERGTRERDEVASPERARSRNADPWRSAPISPLSAPRVSRLFQREPPRAQSMGSTSPPFSSTFSRGRPESNRSFDSRTRDCASSRDYRNEGGSHRSQEPPSKAQRNFPLTPTESSSLSDKGQHGSRDISPAVIDIPHAGEVIKFDLDKQLEPDPAGIIRILTAVKADQKLWMMTAAHYNGKNNLDAARQVLEAGIQMAVLVGEETDTKPFWHLLGQVNRSLQAKSSASSSMPSVSPTASSLSSSAVNSSIGDVSRSDQSIDTSSEDKSCLSAASNLSTSFPNVSERNFSNDKLKEISSSLHALSPNPRPTGPRNRQAHPVPPPSPPIPPLAPMYTPARLQSLQSEIEALRAKQNVILGDLSFVRAAKRRAEDEAKEERSVRRKLEKHIRSAEDALARSKRMEDAALGQVKREVEARRKAEGLLEDIKARKEDADAGSGPGRALFSDPSAANEAAVLFQLASMIRGVPSGGLSTVFQLASGVAGPSSAPNPSKT